MASKSYSVLDGSFEKGDYYTTGTFRVNPRCPTTKEKAAQTLEAVLRLVHEYLRVPHAKNHTPSVMRDKCGKSSIKVSLPNRNHRDFDRYGWKTELVAAYLTGLTTTDPSQLLKYKIKTNVFYNNDYVVNPMLVGYIAVIASAPYGGTYVTCFGSNVPEDMYFESERFRPRSADVAGGADGVGDTEETKKTKDSGDAHSSSQQGYGETYSYDLHGNTVDTVETVETAEAGADGAGGTGGATAAQKPPTEETEEAEKAVAAAAATDEAVKNALNNTKAITKDDSASDELILFNKKEEPLEHKEHKEHKELQLLRKENQRLKEENQLLKENQRLKEENQLLKEKADLKKKLITALPIVVVPSQWGDDDDCNGDNPNYQTSAVESR